MGAGAQLRASRRWRTPAVVALAAAASVVGRLLLWRAPLKADEAGYLLVARAAHPGGRFLYGDLWVDRPPLLIAAYRLADDLGGLGVLRSLALVAVVVLVVAAGWAGHVLGGARGGALAALVAAAYGATPLFSAPEVDGEILAVPFVMLAAAVGLRALLHPQADAPGARRRRSPLLALAAAGFLGACAVLVKQNFTDALALLGVLVVLRAARREVDLRTAAAQLAALVGGALVPVVAVVVWAACWHGSLRVGVDDLWAPLVSFRSQSFSAILGQSLSAPLHRAHSLYRIAMASGMFVLLTLTCLAGLTALRRLDPLPVALLVMVLAGQPAIALGGSFWAHYLVELVPASALAVAHLSTRGEPWRPLAAVLTALACLSTAVSVPHARPGTQETGCQTRAANATTARWLRDASHPGDTVLMLYSGAAVLEESGLTPAYPYQWSLPLRVLDPRTSLLRARMRGPGAATWVLQRLPLDSWGLDAGGRVSAALAADYQLEATVCGTGVYLRDGVSRTLPPVPVQTS